MSAIISIMINGQLETSHFTVSCNITAFTYIHQRLCSRLHLNQCIQQNCSPIKLQQLKYNSTYHPNQSMLDGYSLDFKATSCTPEVSLRVCASSTSHASAHSTTAPTSRSTSSVPLPTCRHTRTRSAPLGTVGHVMCRAFSPRERRNAESARGWGVMRGMMGVGSA